MLWAIDVGNTHTVVGVYADDRWRGIWRLSTNINRTEDELAATLRTLCAPLDLKFEASALIVASVVPGMNAAVSALAEKHLRVLPVFLKNGSDVGLEVRYDPPSAVGADRIANALGALAEERAPIVVVDFGTATTFDAIDESAAYAGGAILPGIVVSMDALSARTALLPRIPVEAPTIAIGRSTIGSLQSGVMFGYAGAIEALIQRFRAELGSHAAVISTGGLGYIFLDLCPSIDRYLPNLTLDGLRLAWEHLNSKG